LATIGMPMVAIVVGEDKTASRTALNFFRAALGACEFHPLNPRPQNRNLACPHPAAVFLSRQ
jgi:hypothetical protein